mgnify:CR=1 FL=1
MRSASEFRQMARETLHGNWKLAMGTGLVASLIGAEIADTKWNIRAAKSGTGTTGSEECADAGISDAQHASALGAFAYLGLDGGYYWRCGADGIRPFPSESGREKGSVLF